MVSLHVIYYQKWASNETLFDSYYPFFLHHSWYSSQICSVERVPLEALAGYLGSLILSVQSLPRSFLVLGYLPFFREDCNVYMHDLPIARELVSLTSASVFLYRRLSLHPLSLPFLS